MRRILLSILAGTLMLASVGTARAGTSLLNGGTANWFYGCADGMAMNYVIRHADQSITQFSLGRGRTSRTAVQRGDVVTWHCGAPVGPADRYTYIVTSP